MRNVKLFVLFLATVAIFLLCGCEIEANYKFAQPFSSITSIQTVYISRENLENPNDFGEVIVYSALDPCEWNTLLSDLQNIQCWRYWNDPPNCTRGRAIQICYENGTIEMVGARSSGTCIKVEDDYKSDDYNWYYFDDEQFTKIWNQYSK